MSLEVGSAKNLLSGEIINLKPLNPAIDKPLIIILLSIALILILTGFALCIFTIMQKRK